MVQSKGAIEISDLDDVASGCQTRLLASRRCQRTGGKDMRCLGEPRLLHLYFGLQGQHLRHRTNGPVKGVGQQTTITKHVNAIHDQRQTRPVGMIFGINIQVQHRLRRRTRARHVAQLQLLRCSFLYGRGIYALTIFAITTR